MPRVRIQRTILVFIAGALLLGAFIFYQYRFSFFNPPLSVTTPKENAVTTQDITIVGKTDGNAVVTVNNEPVVIDKSGNFSKNMSVFAGETSLTIRAKNRMGRETIVMRKINVKPSGDTEE